MDSSCEMIFDYGEGVKAFLKSTLLENTPTGAIFHFEEGIIKINTRFHEPSTVTLIQDGKEEKLDLGYNTIGYNFEVIHFNELIRLGKTESPIMTFEFSSNQIKVMDDVRKLIDFKY